ncbi:MAG: tetratricopeptide repeat protein, partial [Rhodospirillales bacterium]|nr:tetratricopeptide repeat protein [Rhodospirillales bacterium]
EEFEAFLKKYAHHEKADAARFGLALSRYAQADHEQAEPLLRRLTGQNGFERREQAALFWGKSLLALKKNDEAAKAFDWVTENSKDATLITSAHVGAVEAAYLQGNWKDVLTEAAPLLKGKDDSPTVKRVRFQAGMASYELEQFDEASKTLQSLADAKHTHAYSQHASFLLAECYRRGGHLDDAAKYFERAATQYQGRFTEQAWYRLVYVLLENGKHQDAVRQSDAFLKQHKDSSLAAQVKLLQGRARLVGKDYGNAVKTLGLLATHETLGPDAALLLSQAHLARKKPEQAEKALADAAGRFSKSASADRLYYALGNARMQLEKFAEAVDAFDRSAQANPEAQTYLEARSRAAYCLHRAEHYEKSLERCEAILREKPKEAPADVAFLKAENLFLLKRYADAGKAYQAFLSAHADNEQADVARYRIALSHYRQEQWQPAIDAIKRLTNEKLDTAVFAQRWYVSGDSHYQQQQWSDAISALQRFVSEQPRESNIDTARMKLALSQMALRQPGAAATALRELLQKNPESD